METYEVVNRSTRGTVAVNWAAIEEASADGRAALVPLNGALLSTMHAALHHGANRRGFKAHIRTRRELNAVEVWVERREPPTPPEVTPATSPPAEDEEEEGTKP